MKKFTHHWRVRGSFWPPASKCWDSGAGRTVAAAAAAAAALREKSIHFDIQQLVLESKLTHHNINDAINDNN